MRRVSSKLFHEDPGAVMRYAHENESVQIVKEDGTDGIIIWHQEPLPLDEETVAAMAYAARWKRAAKKYRFHHRKLMEFDEYKSINYLAQIATLTAERDAMATELTALRQALNKAKYAAHKGETDDQDQRR